MSDSGKIGRQEPADFSDTMHKLVTIQYLRAIAATAVLVFHAGERFGYSFTAGAYGVDLFFVISGFLMVAITNDETQPGKFLQDRIQRIVPIYWLATSVLVIGAFLGLFPNMKLEWWHTIASYLFLPAPSPVIDQTWPVLIPGWTLNYEMFFYAIFAALLFLRGALLRVVSLSVILLGLVMVAPLTGISSPALAFYADNIVLEFVFGAWIGLAWKMRLSWEKVPPNVVLALGAVLFIAAASSASELPRSILYGVPSALLLAGMLAHEARGKPREIASLELLGDASYSIYLWHGLAVSVAAMIVSKLGLPALVGFVLSIIGGIIGGVISYWIVERPVTNFFRRRRKAKAALQSTDAPKNAEV